MFGLNQQPVQTACFLWGNPGDSNLTTSAAPHSIIIMASSLLGQNVQSFLTNSLCALCACVLSCDCRHHHHPLALLHTCTDTHLASLRGKSSYVRRHILVLSAVGRFHMTLTHNRCSVTITKRPHATLQQILPRYF